ncbi:BLUF domain-containing protein [Nocardioides sp. LHG3406-4]|uniref:BLUF domain-containing protein n=1 Tax=Nocardioides sp. LHG3406-4 TaxID=2804575 RepID=UPI003CE6CF85
MLTITYFSSAAVAFDDQALRELLSKSRARNTDDSITGMLIFHRGNFAQVLEGDEHAVRATFDRICADDRHHSVVVELEDTVDDRTFPDWSMGFRDLADGTAEEIEGFSTFFRDVQAGKDVPGRMPPHHMLRAFSRPETYRPGA